MKQLSLFPSENPMIRMVILAISALAVSLLLTQRKKVPRDRNNSNFIKYLFCKLQQEYRKKDHEEPQCLSWCSLRRFHVSLGAGPPTHARGFFISVLLRSQSPSHLPGLNYKWSVFSASHSSDFSQLGNIRVQTGRQNQQRQSRCRRTTTSGDNILENIAR